MKNHSRMTVKTAASLLGMPEQLLRIGLQQGRFDFGVALKTSSRYSYYINATKLYEYIGLIDKKTQ